MLALFANKVTSFFIAKRWIDPNDKVLSNYMLQCKIMSATSLAILLLIGSLFQGVISTFVFLFCFMSTRKRAGGFHMNAPWKCLLTSIATQCILFIIILPLLMQQPVICTIALLIFAIATFRFIGTVNHPSMHLSCNEIAESRKRLFYIAITEALIAMTILIFFSPKNQLALFIAIGLACTAFSTIVAKVLKQEVNYSHE